jgi:hypothetical protein
MSQPTISKHLMVLERAGLVVRGRDAQLRPSALNAAPLKAANAYLEQFRAQWEARLDRLQHYLGKVQTPMLVLAISVLAAASIQAQQIPDLAPYLIADRAEEIALARSAAPGTISDSATVLVMTRTGFVEAARGSNGFTCVVLRSFSGALNDPGFWNPPVRAPHCFNPPAARTVLPAMLHQAKLVLSGVPRADIAPRLRRAYAGGEFSKPAPGAMAYMLSPRQYLLDDDPHWLPHLMFFYDRSQPATAWGAGGFDATIINGSAGDPNSPVLTLFIPVRRWSDGTPAPPPRPQS